MFLVMFPFLHGWWCGACGSASVLYVVFFSSRRVLGCLPCLQQSSRVILACNGVLYVSFMCGFVMCGFVDQASSLRRLRSVVGSWSC